MPPEITTKIVANNTLQTQCVKIGQVTNYFRGYQEENKYGTGLDVITFDYFDPIKLDFIPGEYHNFGYYNFDETPDPTEQTNFTWIHYGEDQFYKSSNNIGQPVLNEGYDGLRDGLFIFDGTVTGPNYFYHDLTEEDINNIRLTKNGYIDFEIGLCPDAYNRPANYKFTEPTSITKNYFLNGNFAIHNYFAIGAYSENENERFRFILSFIMLWNENRNDQVVYFRPNIVDAQPGDDAVLIPNWNGLTFKKFKFEYIQSVTNNNEVLGTLSYYDGNGQLHHLSTNIQPSDRDATKPYSTQFGVYSSGGRGNMVVKSLNYNAYVTSGYRVTINNDTSQLYTHDEVLEYFKERYKFQASSANTDSQIIVDWNWMHKQSRLTSGGQEYITLENSFFDSTNINSLSYLQNPRKTIKLYSNSDSGPIEELIFGAEIDETGNRRNYRKLSNINTTGAPGLKRLILHYTEISTLDLSDNDNLNVLVCTGGLGDLKLPKLGDLFVLSIYDNGYAPKILNLEAKTNSKVFLGFNYTNIWGIETLILRNISIVNELTDFSEEEANTLNLGRLSKYIKGESFYDLPWYGGNLKLVDISYSNIISDRENLELFLNALPNRTGKENGLIFMYGPKFTVNGIKGDLSVIDTTLENLRKKNWLFYA